MKTSISQLSVLLASMLISMAAYGSDGTVKSYQKISETSGNGPNLDQKDDISISMASIGDLDNDGVTDLAVGAYYDDDGATDAGALYIFFMNTNGTVKSYQKISETTGNGPNLDASDYFGQSVADIGDLDDDGVTDLVVGAYADDDGAYNAGAVYVLFMKADGTVKSYQKISETYGNGPNLDEQDLFGHSVAGIGDMGGDGVEDIVVGAARDDDGATDAGALYVLFMNTNGTVKSYQKISETSGNGPNLDGTDMFGCSVARIGDLDGDGVEDMAAGAYGDDDGGTDAGALYMLFMNTNGTVKSYQMISDTSGNGPDLGATDYFGFCAADAGDLNGDGITDLVVGAPYDDGGTTGAGVAYVLFMNTDGTVKSYQMISETSGNGPELDEYDRFGISAAGMGDMDGDTVRDIAVGAYGDDDGAKDEGAVYVLFLNGVIDASATVQFNPSSYSVNEDAATVTLTVSRTGAGLGTASVDYGTSNGTASAGSDYTSASGTLSWSDGDTADKTITVSITDDSLDEDDETFTVTLSNAIGAGLGSPNVATVTIADNDNEYDIDDGLVAYWPFSSNANDESGNGNHGTINGATLTTDRCGIPDSAYLFDGTNDYICVPYSATNGLHPVNIPFTVCAWFNTTASSPSQEHIVTTHYAGMGYDGYFMTVDSRDNGGKLLWWAHNRSGEGVVSVSPVNDGQWHFCVGLWDGTQTVLYVDAVLQGSKSGVGSSSYSYQSDFRIGHVENNNAPWALDTQYYFKGKIDDVRVYDRVLSVAEIEELYDTSCPNGIVQFSSSSCSVDEDAGTVTLTVSRTGNGSGEASVDYSTSDGTASAGLDYTSRSGTLSWSDGDTSDKTITISITDDSLDEEDETFTVMLSSPNGAGLGSPSIATVTIVDNDITPYTLTVTGSPAEHGVSSPYGYGSHPVTPCTVITNTVATPADEANGTRYVLSGWTGSGSVPASGSTNLVSFTIGQDSILTWNWLTEYWLDTTAGPNGTVDVEDGWYLDGSQVTITATPDTDCYFLKWTGDVPEGLETSNPLTLTMDQARLLTANFTSPPDLNAAVDLSVTKSVDNAAPSVGDSVTYTIEVANLSANTATGVEVTDVLPSSTIFGSATTSQGSHDNVSGVWTVGTLGPNASAKLIISATITINAEPTPDVTAYYSVTLVNSIYTPSEYQDHFGYSISSIGDNLFVVGAPGDSGSVYVYDTSGTLIASIPNPEPASYDHFGYSASGIGTNMFVVGTSYDDPGGVDNAGSVYLYDTSGTLLASIANPEPQSSDEFGAAVSGVGSNMFVVGAYQDYASGVYCAGSVYLYDTRGTLLASIPNPEPGSYDHFGWSVSGVGNNMFVVGAHRDYASGVYGAGSVYLYDTSGTLLASIPNPEPGYNDYFGCSVSGVSSNMFVVGSYYDDPGGTYNAGSAYLYDTSGTLLASIANPAPDIQDEFGAAVSGVGSDMFVISAPGDSSDVGNAYLYNTSGTLLATMPNPEPESSLYDFGWAVAGVGNDMFLVSAPYVGDPYLYEISVERVDIANTALITDLDQLDSNTENNSNSAIVVITFPGTVQFSPSSYSVNEDAGIVTLTVTRTGGSAGAASVDYITSDGTASAGSDYTSRYGTLSWSDGETADKTITISITDDSLVEDDETFTVTLSNASGAGLGTPNVAIVTIADNDEPPEPGTVQFNPSSYSVDENAGTVTLTVTRTGGSTGAATVDYGTSDGTASAGSDYTSASGTLTWSDGDASSKTIIVAITDDSMDEADETFTVTLSNASGAGLASPSSATVTIADNDVLYEADLELSDLRFLPVNLWAGDNPAMISFELANYGPEDLSDAQLEYTFYLSSNTTFGDGDDIAIGTMTEDISLSAGTQTTIRDPGRSHNADVTIPEGVSGDYYVFVSVRHASSSGSCFSDPDGAYAMRDGPINVRIHPSDESGEGDGTDENSGHAKAVNDYDGDGKSDLAVYQNVSGYWYILLSAGSEVAYQKFGASGYAPVPGDYDGDGKTDLAVYQEASGYWYVLPSSTYSLAYQKFGEPGYEPVSGDFDGDGKTDLTVYHEASGYWFVLPSSTYSLAYQKFGESGYTPVSGDFDGDGKSDLAVYHEASGYWYILPSTSYSLAYMKFGETGYEPVSGDFDGDGKSDLAVYHEASGYWYVLSSESGTVSCEKLGGMGYEPVPGDYDGDGITDMVVYYETSGYWDVLFSPTSAKSSVQFGGPGYVPVGVFR